MNAGPNLSRVARTIAGVALLAISAWAVVAYLATPTESGDRSTLVSLDSSLPQAVALGAIAVALIASLALSRPRWRSVGAAVLLWGGLALVLVAGYASWNDLGAVGRRTLAALVPGYAVSDGSGSVTIARDAAGHFAVTGAVDGAPTRFMIDTGASSVVLTSADAANAGIATDALDYSRPVQTANGVGWAAPVTIDQLSIGDLTLENLPALIARPGALDTSLIGMNALNRLSGFSVSGNTMILTR